MLRNQIKVLLQRVYLSGRKPARILLPKYMKDALRMEMAGSPDYVKNTFPKDDIFYGLPVNTNKFATEILIALEPKEGAKTIDLGLDKQGSIGPYQPSWKPKKKK